jgi:thiamine-monophosphate kinase
VGLAVSNRFPVEALDEFYAGLKLACERYKVDIVGGDTTSSTTGMFISITVLGDVAKEDVVYRAGAKEHDLICVSGDLGGAYAGLLLLEREKVVFRADPEMQPDLEGYDYPLERQLKPEARTDIVKKLKIAGLKPTSMIDISDGLASEIMHLCKNSTCGAAIYEDKLPVDAATVTLAEEFKLDPTTVALNGGEDYELLFTIPITELKRIQEVENVTIIGHITDVKDGLCMITRSGQSVPVLAQGWDALSKREDSGPK